MSLYKRELISDYKSIRPHLESFLPILKRQLEHQLAAAGVEQVNLGGRIKRTSSLLAKISRPDRTYSQLWDITDLIGIRVVTGFEDAITEIARVIEARYEVDLARSTNRLKFEDHERFGYRSLHYVCSLPRDLDFPPHLLKHVRFEIQVRTALQNVWAEIEHDLGYKASDIASSTLRRRFSRISSLLEIADEELAAIRVELKRYVESRRDHPQLDLVSFDDLVAHETVTRVDLQVARHLALETDSEPFFPDYLVRALRLAGFSTVQEIVEALDRLEPGILAFLAPYFTFAEHALGFPKSSLGSVPRGYCLLFLAHLRVMEGESLAVNRVRRFAQFYGQLDYPDDAVKARSVAESLVKMVT